MATRPHLGLKDIWTPRRIGPADSNAATLFGTAFHRIQNMMPYHVLFELEGPSRHAIESCNILVFKHFCLRSADFTASHAAPDLSHSHWHSSLKPLLSFRNKMKHHCRILHAAQENRIVPQFSTIAPHAQVMAISCILGTRRKLPVYT